MAAHQALYWARTAACGAANVGDAEGLGEAEATGVVDVNGGGTAWGLEPELQPTSGAVASAAVRNSDRRWCMSPGSTWMPDLRKDTECRAWRQAVGPSYRPGITKGIRMRRSGGLGAAAWLLGLTFSCSVGLLAAVAGALGGGGGVTVGTAVTAYACGPAAPPVEGICAAGESVGSGPVATTTWELPIELAPGMAKVLTFAIAQLGKPYVWGAEGPESYDCSGLVVAAFAQVGLALPRVTYDQVSVGTPIYIASQAEPGDLLFFTGSDPGPLGAPGHVAIYLGAGVMEHAPQTGDVVKLSPVPWDAVVAIRRVLL
jgi:hypothetical protein